MSPLLKHGDRLLILRHYSSRRLQLGQIVVGSVPFYLSPNIDEKHIQTEKLFIKTVVGLPGDEIVIPLSKVEQSWHKLLVKKCDRKGNLVWQVPTGHCFVRGNSKTSIDSILWGPVPMKSLVGVVCLKLHFKAKEK